MRKRSLSVACERAVQLDEMTNKFEGVPSDHDSENEIEEDKRDGPDANWTQSDYKALMEQLRSVLPRKDTKKYHFTLNKIDWKCVAFEQRTADEVKAVTEAFIAKIRKHRTLSEMIEDIPLHAKKRTSLQKPKNPLNAYNFFMKERYTHFKNKNPDLHSTEVFKLIHKEYSVLSEKKKRKYEAMAADAREVYNHQIKQYYRDHPEAAKSSYNSNSQIITPFSLFQQEKRNASQEITHAEMRSQWNQLEVKKKLKYIQQAFKSQTEDTTKALKLTKEEQSLIEHARGRPIPIPHSTSEYYLKHYAECKSPSTSMGEWRKQKIAEFKNLPKVKKLELEIEYRQAKQDFVTDYENYITSITDEAEQRVQIQQLKSFIEKKMDKDDRQQLPDESRPYSFMTSQLENEMLPIAESTVLKTKTKKMKNSALVLGSTETASPRPLKSILKSPAKKDAQTFAEPAVPKSKRKHSLQENDSDSSSEKKSKRSRVPIVEPVLKKNSSEANGTTSSAAKTMSEPVRPPTSILEYYLQNHYLGKAEKCEESFKKLSSNRKALLREELRLMQKKYFTQLQKYLKTVPPEDVKKYVRKVKQAQTDFQLEDRLLNESGLVEKDYLLLQTKPSPKREPQTSSSSEESSEDEKSKNNPNSGSADDDSSDNE